MKKVVYRLDIPDINAKRKAMKAVSTLRGIDFISIDINAKTLTVIGLVDPVDVVSILRKKTWQASIITVGPAKEPEKPKEEAPKGEAKKEEAKKEEAKKEEPKKEEPKAEEAKKEEPKKEEPKKEEEKKKEPQEIPPEEFVKAYNRAYYPPYVNTYYYTHSMEDNPNGCVIS